MKETARNQTPQKEIVKQLVGEWSNMIGPPLEVNNDGSLKKYLDRVFSIYTANYIPETGFEFFFYEKTGMPSPIIRIDMPLIGERVSPMQGFFEIESRPAGLGLDSVLFEEHKDAFAAYVEQLSAQLDKPLAVKMFPYAQQPKYDPGKEKKEFAQLMGMPFFDIDERPDNIDDFYFFAYGNVGSQEELEAFERRSLFPLRDDGNKEYLVSMGAAQVADRLNVSKRMALGAPFALKPRKGMWAQNVLVYPGDPEKARFSGYATEKEVHDLIGNERAFDDKYLMQPFFSPGVLQLGGQPYLAMARVYAFANPQSGEYEVSNGIYIARQNIRLHGTADAITGHLILK